MVRLSLKSALGHKRRLVGTGLSVIIGIAFLAGTFVFTDTIKRTFDNLFSDVYATTDAVVRSNRSLDVDFGEAVRDRLPDSVVGEVAALPGVEIAEGDVQGFARLIGADGDPVGQEQGPPTFGGVITDSELSPWRLTDGSRLPVGPEEIVVDKGSADAGDLEIGQPVTVIAQGGSRSFTVVGIARFGDADSALGTTWALFDLATAEEFVVGQPGRIDSVLVRGDGSASQEELAASIRSGLPADADLEVITGQAATEEDQSDIEQGLNFFNILLLVFAGISLFVSAFIIYNTFSIIVAQRQREDALLRAVGASRAQVLGSMLIEAVIIGVIASALGFLGGIAMASLLEAGLGALGIDIPSGGVVLKPRTAIVSLIVGVLVTVVAAVFPSIRASKTPPVAAMRDVALDRSGTSKGRLVAGLVITGLGVAGTLVGLTGQITMLALGIPLLFIGVFVLGPLIARPVSRLIGAPLPAARGMTGTLARENASRNPKRTARTAAALMVGVALVTGISVLASSIKASVREIFDEQFTGDFVVSTQAFGFGGLPPTLANELNELPEVADATGVGIGFANVDGDDRQLTLLDPSTAGAVFDLDFQTGAVEDLTDEGILVSQDRAERDGLAIGDTVPVTLLGGQQFDLAVQGIYAKDDLTGPYSVSKGLYAQSGADQFDFSVFVLTAQGVSEADAEAAITEAAAAYPTGDVQSRSDYIAGQGNQINQFVNLIYGLLGLAVVIAVFGIANTLSLSVYERTRELGLLRAVGMYRAQVRSSVRWESVITALLGAVQGIVIGILLGFAVVYALRDEGLDRFELPFGALVVIIVLAIACGVVAAIRPARRAARLDVLRAVASE